ncbi:hypothetical protein ESZ50_08440 [Weissella muntiaci]|jgi:hypothetical protein|uniref:Uncharacterized protein n=1 Tax=Weissella muntiaci TaxID=2508881 RepID=A0A6C2C494_9LACO|nr:hypothetical protein [Weissella muntiaci]TYC48383.1 hypothetical protein ESZ50_08440 [Weissella muntiaci]
MSLVAGTIIFTRDDQSYFLVADTLPKQQFYTVKMHRHEGDTALGSLLTGLKTDLGIDPNNLRLGEIAGWRMDGNEVISLYTLDAVDSTAFDLTRLDLVGVHFVSARDAAELLLDVDMMAAVRLD